MHNKEGERLQECCALPPCRNAREKGWTVKADGDKGYRRVVASPQPQQVLEARAIKARPPTLMQACELFLGLDWGFKPKIKY